MKIYERPEKAISSPNDLVPGKVVWHVYLDSTGEAQPLTVMMEPVTYQVMKKIKEDPVSSESSLNDTLWVLVKEYYSFESNVPRYNWHSVSDMSADERGNYNNNYIFRNAHEAKEAIENKKLLPVKPRSTGILFSYLDYFTYYDPWDYNDRL